MPPAPPVLITVMAAMAERLVTIKAGTVVYDDLGVTAEYWLTPATVTRSVLDIDQYRPEQLPLLGLVRSSWATAQRLSHDDIRGHEFVVTLVGYVLGDHDTVDGIVATDLLAQLYDDARTALMLDRTLGGLVDSCDPHPQGRVDTDDGVLEPRALFEEPWLIRV